MLALGGAGPSVTAASSGPEEDGVDFTGPASLKILMGVLQSFFPAPPLLVSVLPSNPGAGQGGRVGSEGYKEEPVPVRSVVPNQSYGSSSVLVLRDPFSC